MQQSDRNLKIDTGLHIYMVMDGEAALAALPDGEELGSHALFGQTVKEARARCVLDHSRRWDAADAKEWAKYATKLERLFPQEYGRSDKRMVEQRTLSISVTAQLSPDQADALLRVLARRDQSLLMSPPTSDESGSGSLIVK